MKRKALIILFAVVFGFVAGQAQQIAVTQDGTRVVLYNNGTWRYLDRGNPGLPSERPSDGKAQIYFDRKADGNKAIITIRDDISFYIEYGRLKDFKVLNRHFGPNGVPDDYLIEYEFNSDQVKKIGPYKIEYRTFEDDVTSVGGYRIDYEAFDKRIRQIGDTRIKYNFFNNRIEKIEPGRNPNLTIELY